MGKFKKVCRGLPDPRAANALHELFEILVIALAAVLCGAKGPTDMALFGCSKEKLLRQFLRLEYGIPSHDTFSRVFRALDPKAFEQGFRRCIAIGRLPRRCSSVAPTTHWRSSKIRANCSMRSCGALPAPASAALPSVWNRPRTTGMKLGAPPSFATPAWLPQTAFPVLLPW